MSALVDAEGDSAEVVAVGCDDAVHSVVKAGCSAGLYRFEPVYHSEAMSERSKALPKPVESQPLRVPVKDVSLRNDNQYLHLINHVGKPCLERRQQMVEI